jgi:methylmalonyl-CoA mutase
MKSLENLRNQTFPSKTKQDWKEKAEESLRGKTIESLKSTTYENIILKPLYTRQDEQLVPDYPGGSDLRRGIYPLGYVTNEWKVAQRISYQTHEELKAKLHQAEEEGQTALSFEVTKKLFGSNDSFSSLFTDLFSKPHFAVNSKGWQSTLLANLVTQTGSEENITGYIANDPISLFAESGFIYEEFFQEWSEDVRLANERFPNLRTVLIDTTPYHNGGANAVQELGIAVAEGVFYLQQLNDSGIDTDTALSKMVFQFSIGSNFFMEVAKLRAARILWNKITAVYGAEGTSQGMQIAGETSSFTMTVHDPHVNLLRAGNEAFAAVVGGVQYLHVVPYNDMTGSNSLAERIARNIQLILKEEAHLQKVIDPAGGSWYIEQLTTQLAERAWSFFQQIEADGGILEVLKANGLQREIEAVYQQRNKDILTRKLSIVGTNVYANLDETVPPIKINKNEPFFVNGNDIDAIPHRRLSEPYEEMRNKAKRLEEKTGSIPTVGMLCLGELKQHKARLDFMKGFLAPGGIRAIESNPIFALENARQFVLDISTKHVCFCGTNEQYETTGSEILSSLKVEFPDRVFYLAGMPEKDKQSKWINKGIKQFIHVKSNCYETLSTILKEQEVTIGEETKA